MPSPGSVRKWTVGGLLSLVVTLVTYVTGAMSGFTQVAKICAVKAGRGPSDRPDSITDSGFPLSQVCHWRDGTSVDLVPAWVNPLLYAGLTALVVCSALAVYAAAKRKKEHVHE